MTKFIAKNSIYLALSAPALIILFIVLIVQANWVNFQNPYITFAITFDLLITSPIFYLLLIRKTKVPHTTIIPIFILGLVVGTSIIPKENQYFLHLFKFWVLPVIELSILLLVIVKVRATIKKFKQAQEYHQDFYTILKVTCSTIVPQKIVPVVATELAMIYYGFIRWKKNQLQENEFSYHKKSSTQILLGAIIMLLIVETFAIHLLVIKWNAIVAWVLFGLSIYTVLQLFGFLKSISQRPIYLDDEYIYFRYGFMAETIVHYTDIESIEVGNKVKNVDKLTKKLSIFGDLESYNIILKLKQEQKIDGLYGLKKKYSTLLFFVDDKEKFISKVLIGIAKHQQ